MKMKMNTEKTRKSTDEELYKKAEEAYKRIERVKDAGEIFEKKGFMKRKKTINSNVTGPIMILLGKNRKARIYEKVDVDEFILPDSEGEEGKIIMDDNKLYDLEWGGERIKMYVCNYKEAVPLLLLLSSLTSSEIIKRSITKHLEEEKATKTEG